MVNSKPGQMYYTLDAMRGIAAIIVVFLHVGIMLGGFIPTNAYLAVDFFFCLSGFVIANAYDNKLATMPWQEFMVKRLIRLYPLYLLGTIIGSLALFSMYIWGQSGLFIRGHLQVGFMSAAILGPVFIPSPFRILVNGVHPFPFDHPAWTLFFELIANFVYAYFYRNINARALTILIAVSGLCILGAALHYNDADFGWRGVNLLLGLPRVSFSFFVGVLLFRLKDAIRIRPFLSPLISLVAIFCLLMAPIPKAFHGLYGAICILLLFPSLILLAIKTERRNPRYRAAFTYLGVTSYGIYVLHVPLAMVLMNMLHTLPPALTHPHIVQILSAFVVALSLLTVTLDRFYDRPLRARLNKFASKFFAVPGVLRGSISGASQGLRQERKVPH